MATTDLAEINFRKGTASQWTTANPTLLSGEPGYETDTHLVKIGDGVTVWNSLDYQAAQIAGQIHLATAKTVPVDADEFAIVDSAASNVIKKLTWANIKAAWAAATAILTNKTLTSPSETTNIVAAAPGATQNIDAITAQDWLFTTNAANDFAPNIRGDGTHTLASQMLVGQTKTFALRVTNGATPYKLTGLTIDGSAQTLKWANGSAITSGNASSTDNYVIAITMTAAATYLVQISLTKFA